MSGELGGDGRSRPSRRADGAKGRVTMNHKQKYAGWGIALGAALGAAAGAMAGNTGVWLAIGVAIGLLIGLSSRRKTQDCPHCEQIHRTHDLKNGANQQVG